MVSGPWHLQQQRRGLLATQDLLQRGVPLPPHLSLLHECGRQGGETSSWGIKSNVQWRMLRIWQGSLQLMECGNVALCCLDVIVDRRFVIWILRRGELGSEGGHGRGDVGSTSRPGPSLFPGHLHRAQGSIGHWPPCCVTLTQGGAGGLRARLSHGGLPRLDNCTRPPMNAHECKG